ncbi:unnamed protein product [Orchesella dallaii]|uniref:Uncharacterized protein n=1 Tax=Orchesella dallaii TaxID=48710 RepID=A0ABP1RW76_9HEXA
MEPWQIAHVQKNLDDLTRFTNCNSSLVAILQKRDILSVIDISRLEAKRKSDGAIAETSLLFEILVTRAGITQAELKLFAKFGQRIGDFGEDTSQLDYVILENMVGIEEICKIKGVNQVNVHLIEHTDGYFKLVQTFGDDSKIRKFVEKPLMCDYFPDCGCERGYENLIFKCIFHFQGYFYENITKEYSTTLNELLPEMRELLNIQDSVDLWEITNLLDKISVVNDSQEEEERELRELKNLATTLFPRRIKNLIINNHVLEKFVTAGLVVKKEDE